MKGILGVRVTRRGSSVFPYCCVFCVRISRSVYDNGKQQIFMLRLSLKKVKILKGFGYAYIC